MIDAPRVQTLTPQEQQALDAYVLRVRKMPTEDVGAELIGLRLLIDGNLDLLDREWDTPDTYELLQAQMKLWQRQSDAADAEITRRRVKNLLPLGQAVTAITPEVIADVKSRVDLCDLIERSGVTLKKSGKSFVGLCPFHNDRKTPNFHVYPDPNQHFHCYSCGKHGDALSFVMLRENLDFIAALKELSGQVGIELPHVYKNGHGKHNGTGHGAETEAKPSTTSRQTPPTSAEYISKLAELGYSFRMNDLDDGIEICGKRLTDPVRSVIRSQMRDSGFRGMDALEDAYTANAYANRYHPIQAYLDALKWDGKPNIATLAKHFENPDGAFPIWLRRWMVGSVAKAKTASQNPMLVLEGPQGIGKSTVARWLCPLPEYFIEAPINPEDKDASVRLMSRWIWEVSELGSTVRRADREALKAFISQQTVTVRKAYGRQDTIKPALASLIGTVNNDGGILSDPTGSRRFLVCRIENIDWAYHSLDVSQLWAEACVAYNRGERWTLSEEEKQRAKEINEQYEIDDPVAAMIAKFYVLDKASDEWTSSLEIQETLENAGLRGTTRMNGMAISSAMKSLGFEGSRKYRHGRQTRGFLGVERRKVG